MTTKNVFSISKTPIIIIIPLFIIIFYIITTQPKVSIVMPTYNRADYLPQAIDSVLNQTLQNFELIIVDDGSTDNTPFLLKNYQKKSNKIKVITHTENKGVSAARNTGNKHATGKYIAILDSDDYFLPDYLEETVSFMEKHPTLTIGIPVKSAYHDDKKNPNKKVAPYLWHYPAYDFLDGNHLGNVGNIFKRDFIIKHNIQYNINYTCAEDYDFWIQMILKGASIGKINTQKSLVVFKAFGGLSVTSNCEKTSSIIRQQLHQKINYLYEKEKFDLCLALEHTIETFPNIFLENEKREIKKICPLKTDVFIKAEHPYWKDYLIFTNGATKIYRKQGNDSALILLFIPFEKIIIKWERWGKETFVYNKAKNTYIFSK